LESVCQGCLPIQGRVTASDLRVAPFLTLRSLSSRSSCLVHLLSKEDPHVVGEGGILRLPSSNLEKLVCGKQSLYPPPIQGRPPLSEGRNFTNIPIQLKAVSPREQLLIHLLSEEDPCCWRGSNFTTTPPPQSNLQKLVHGKQPLCCANYNTCKCTNRLQYSVLQVRGRSHRELCCKN
jgi:hypothetical protein